MSSGGVGSSGEGRMTGAGGDSLRTVWWTAREPRGAAVIVHGHGEHAARYEHVARALNQRGISVFSFDHRGHGLSAGDRGHAASFAVLLEDLDRAWSEAGTVLGRAPGFLIGHSMGGLVAVAWAVSRMPELKGLVLSAPWLATAVPVPWWKIAAGRIAARILPRIPMDTGTRVEALTTDPEVIAGYEADPLVHSTITPKLYVEVERGQEQVREATDQVKVHTLFFVPGADRLADASTTLTFAEALPREMTTIVELPGFHHEPFNETGRSEVIARLCAWLEARMA